MGFFSTARPFFLSFAVGLGYLLASRQASAQDEVAAPRRLAASAAELAPPATAGSFPTAGGKPYPINLPTAMKLGNARGLDIALASRRVQAAAAQLQGAKVLWLPNLIFGTDYYRHDGPNQDVTGVDYFEGRQGFMVGGAPYLVVNVADAIFQPLAARQTVRARQAQVQAAANDTLLAVTQAYFNVQQARGELAGYRDALRYADDVLRRLDKLAPGLVPALEANRARVLAARLRQVGLQSQNTWRASSAELLRVLYLDPTLVVEPVEPPHLRVPLLPLDKPVDDLIPVALTNRPELAAQQALVQASLRLLKLEKLRPLMPSLLLRGFSTPVVGTLGYALFDASANGIPNQVGARLDMDMQAVWTLQNFGFGNRALIHQREADRRAALVELFRVQDRVAAEVVQAYSLAQTAEGRIHEAEAELHDAQTLMREDLAALGHTHKLGEGGPIQLVARPLEVIAAVQMLQQAYVDFYTSINDYNRAQFQLYRALGNPAQTLAMQDEGGASAAACGEAAPPPFPTGR
ncbi:MAG TPA: TolC family protein [Gemmataceae bacterium]|nr:TolC family protein [Gemmataceae bacterium]